MGDTLRLLWTASRDWTDPLKMWNVLSECHVWAREQGKTLICVHGDAPGGDMICKLFAQITPGVEEEAHPADWEGPCRDRCKPGHRRKNKRGRAYCPAAGNYRNEEMAALGGDRAAAFIYDRSPGASHGASEFKKAGIPTRRYTDA
jgi:hypothetical protein